MTNVLTTERQKDAAASLLLSYPDKYTLNWDVGWNTAPLQCCECMKSSFIFIFKKAHILQLTWCQNQFCFLKLNSEENLGEKFHECWDGDAWYFKEDTPSTTCGPQDNRRKNKIR